MVTVTSGANVQATISGSVTAGLAVPTASQTLFTSANAKAGTAVTAGTGITVRTVTALKTFYVTGIQIGTSNAAGTECVLKDGGSGGTIKACGINAIKGPIITLTPLSPIAFTTDVWLDVGTSGTVYYTITGFEQ